MGVYYQTGGYFDLIGYAIQSGDTTVTEITFATPFTLNQPVSSDTAYNNYVSYYDSKGGFYYYGAFQAGPSPVIITVNSWDSVNKKISGTFSGMLYSNSNSDSVNSTKGQFNLTYIAN